MPARDVPPAVRPRYARIAASGAALLVTLVAVLGGLGALPVSASSAGSGRPAAAAGRSAAAPGPSGGVATSLTDGGRSPSAAPSAAASAKASPSRSVSASSTAPTGAPAVPTKPGDALPAGSGPGKRVVFDMSAQRVWLVAPGDQVKRTYLVSGSLTDNLRPGRYEVYSRSLHAVGVDDSGTMQYMVRFTRGDNAAIGFHDIPVLDGDLVQTRSQLGEPMSHGCVRQWRPDAQALWAFAPLGTRVVVLA